MIPGSETLSEEAIKPMKQNDGTFVSGEGFPDSLETDRGEKCVKMWILRNV